MRDLRPHPRLTDQEPVREVQISVLAGPTGDNALKFEHHCSKELHHCSSPSKLKKTEGRAADLRRKTGPFERKLGAAGGNVGVPLGPPRNATPRSPVDARHLQVALDPPLTRRRGLQPESRLGTPRARTPRGAGTSPQQLRRNLPSGRAEKRVSL